MSVDIEADQLAYGLEMIEKEKNKIIDNKKYIKGTCVRWKETFGFIRPENFDIPDVFIDVRDIQSYKKSRKSLSIGDIVVFQIEKNSKGYKAKNLKILNGGN